jgi:hypothetical protein
MNTEFRVRIENPNSCFEKRNKRRTNCVNIVIIVIAFNLVLTLWLTRVSVGIGSCVLVDMPWNLEKPFIATLEPGELSGITLGYRLEDRGFESGQ